MFLIFSKLQRLLINRNVSHIFQIVVIAYNVLSPSPSPMRPCPMPPCCYHHLPPFPPCCHYHLTPSSALLPPLPSSFLSLILPLSTSSLYSMFCYYNILLSSSFFHTTVSTSLLVPTSPFHCRHTPHLYRLINLSHRCQTSHLSNVNLIKHSSGF